MFQCHLITLASMLFYECRLLFVVFYGFNELYI